MTTRQESSYWFEARRLRHDLATNAGLDLDPAQALALAQAKLGPVATALELDLELDLEHDLVWQRALATAQHEIDHRRGRPHDHGRLRETGVPLAQDHHRVADLGHDPENGHQPAPKAEEPPGPSPRPPQRQRAPGRAGTATPSQQHDENAEENENIDPITQYLRDVPDPADDWVPFQERKRR
jgi:hypothetical protein